MNCEFCESPGVERLGDGQLFCNNCQNYQSDEVSEVEEKKIPVIINTVIINTVLSLSFVFLEV